MFFYKATKNGKPKVTIEDVTPKHHFDLRPETLDFVFVDGDPIVKNKDSTPEAHPLRSFRHGVKYLNEFMRYSLYEPNHWHTRQSKFF